MSQKEENEIQPNPIQKLVEALDKESSPKMKGPGVWYLTVNQCGELYVIEQTSPMISEAAKAYGKQHPDYAGLLFFAFEDDGSGSKIIDYEFEQYAVAQGLPGHDTATLRTAAIYGAEHHPEYFGAYPAPIYTPWGCMLRYRCLDNGIFWMETDQQQEALCICYPIWDACLSLEAVKLGVTIDQNQKCGNDASFRYIYFKKPNACIAIFELMKTHREWGQTGRISVPELMNAIWKNHPGYVLIHNTREQLGFNDIICGLLDQLGIKAEPNISSDNMISLFPGSGEEYIRF